jgi:hypothetical protein
MLGQDERVRRWSMRIGCCPECDADIVFRSDIDLGLEITCRTCFAILVVVGISPIELDWVYEDDQMRVGEDDLYVPMN